MQLPLSFKFKEKILSGNAWLVWVGFAGIVLLEFLLFRAYLYSEIINYYPAAFDQASYLAQIYSLYENIIKYGFFTSLQQFTAPATVPLFPLQAVTFFFFFGASRFNALLLNFIYFVVLQGFLLITVRHFTKRIYPAFILLGLLWAAKTSFLDVGGMVDFRVDFMAFCLYGIFITSVIRSEIFLSRKWTFIVTILGCFLIFMRTITLVYLIGILGLLFIYLLARFCIVASDKTLIKTRIINLLIFAICVLLIISPYLWISRDVLYNYYVVGHFLGPEKHIRAAQMGVTGFISDIKFYPWSLIRDHLYVAFYLILLLFAFSWSQRKIILHSPNIRLKSYSRESIVFLLLSILIPLVILTADPAKSPIVAGIVIVPILWLAIWPLLLISDSLAQKKKPQLLLAILTAVIFIAGLSNQVYCLTRYSSVEHHRDLAQITKMYDDIGNYALAKKWPEIRFSVDRITEALTSGGITVLYYERHGVIIPVANEPLGGVIFSITKAQAMQSLHNSNVVILTMGHYPQNSVLPFDQSVKMFAPILHQYASKHFIKLGDYSFQNNVYRVYVKSK